MNKLNLHARRLWSWIQDVVTVLRVLLSLFGSSFQKSKGKMNRMGRTVLCAMALGTALVAASLPGHTLTVLGSGIFLYGPGGAPYETVGYSIADFHVFDPDEVEIGEIDQSGYIWNLEETSVIGYTIE